ncbi:hypothetical protein [Dubosiella muris]|uniref:Uncharacterized protein n=2 Tax=Dubosiella TaxID=1937008 RepID=A0AC61R8D4_9FIRM|nr:hypothetical protein [Dubosiella muris]TGY66269.1 hypothetical protein E5336_05325 [Dubosiella muris]
MRKNYKFVIAIFGIGLGLIVFVILFYSLKPSVQIRVTDKEIECKAVKFNLNTVIPLDSIRQVDLVTSPVSLYDGTTLKGPLTKGQSEPRSMMMKTLGAGADGISTEQYAAGKGEIEGVGPCLVYIYWQQNTYIVLTLEDGSLIALNENGDASTKALNDWTEGGKTGGNGFFECMNIPCVL